MSKQFKDMKSVCKWLKDVYDATANETRTTITEQVYKDSNEFTYRDTGEMYKSGQANSDFRNGIIIERTPFPWGGVKVTPHPQSFYCLY